MRYYNITFPFTSLLISSIVILQLTSCSDNTNNNVSQTQSGTTVSQHANSAEPSPDSLQEEPKDTISVKPLKPLLSFTTAQEAIDYMNSSAHATEYANGILHQMAKDEVSYVAKLLSSDYDKFLIIDKQIMRAGLFDKYGREILSYGIAGSRNYGTKHKKADSRTPEGFFSVEGIYDSTDWLFTDDNGHTSKKKGQFGPRFIRIKNPVSTQIGLHGTSAPGSIGARTSHGCIRVTNDNILELVAYVCPGMPVIISPGQRDQQVNEKEGYTIPMITMDPYGKYRPSYTAQPIKKKEEEPHSVDENTSDTLPENSENPNPSIPNTTPSEPTMKSVQEPDSI